MANKARATYPAWWPDAKDMASAVCGRLELSDIFGVRVTFDHDDGVRHFCKVITDRDVVTGEDREAWVNNFRRECDWAMEGLKNANNYGECVAERESRLASRYRA